MSTEEAKINEELEETTETVDETVDNNEVVEYTYDDEYDTDTQEYTDGEYVDEYEYVDDGDYVEEDDNSKGSILKTVGLIGLGALAAEGVRYGIRFCRKKWKQRVIKKGKKYEEEESAEEISVEEVKE